MDVGVFRIEVGQFPVAVDCGLEVIVNERSNGMDVVALDKWQRRRLRDLLGVNNDALRLVVLAKIQMRFSEFRQCHGELGIRGDGFLQQWEGTLIRALTDVRQSGLIGPERPEGGRGYLRDRTVRIAFELIWSQIEMLFDAKGDLIDQREDLVGVFFHFEVKRHARAGFPKREVEP